ncbi:MAG TPA: hypothetical protein VI704_06410 [Bacteroidota bacterium]|nr:hypothetical protein [Bacteroidota bacterium]
MKTHELTHSRLVLQGFAIATLAFAGSLSIMFAYSFLVDGIGNIDWEWCLRYSLVLGVVLPWLRWARKSIADIVKHGSLLT